MGWVIALIVILIIGACMDSGLGMIAIGAGVVALGMLLLEWITGLALFAVLAKICAVIIVLIVVGSILMAIFN